MQLQWGLREAGATMKVKHIVELLDEAYTAYNVATTRS